MATSNADSRPDAPVTCDSRPQQPSSTPEAQRDTSTNPPDSIEMTGLRPQPQSQPNRPSEQLQEPLPATASEQQLSQPEPLSLPPTEKPPSPKPAESPDEAPQSASGLSPPQRSPSEAIGPSTNAPNAQPNPANGPTLVMTILLTSGKRHPWRIDMAYLTSRNVNAEDNDPLNISVYTLKELIWTDWRRDWESRPSSPHAIRLIFFGQMLDDKHLLKDCRFQLESPNVVHMTIRPQEVIDEEEARPGKTGSHRDRDSTERTAGCRCVIL